MAAASSGMHSLSEGHKERLREKIIKGAKNFDKYLNDKCFKIVCEDDTEVIVRFFQDDFIHFTGLRTDLGDRDFYANCLGGTISTGNIETIQKYDWSTLKKKSNGIEIIHQLFYDSADKSLLLNNLQVHTTVFPVAVRNDEIKICMAFANRTLNARSLRCAHNSMVAESEKKINAIYGKKNGEEGFSEIVYQKKVPVTV